MDTRTTYWQAPAAIAVLLAVAAIAAVTGIMLADPRYDPQQAQHACASVANAAIARNPSIVVKSAEATEVNAHKWTCTVVLAAKEQPDNPKYQSTVLFTLAKRS